MIWSLQALRFLAALMVVLCHTAEMVPVVTGHTTFLTAFFQQVGSSGVDLFFVLSGVVISKTSSGATPGEFLWRRFRRIYPIYWISTIPLVLIQIINFGYSSSWRSVVSTITLWPVTNVLTYSIDPVAWTLSYEVLFYLTMAILLVERRLLKYVLLSYFISMSLRQHLSVFQYLGNPLCMEFIAGVVLARIPKIPKGFVAVPIGVLSLATTGYLDVKLSLGLSRSGNELSRVFAYGIPATAIVFGALRVRSDRNVLSYLGDASYSIYLFHISLLYLLLPVWFMRPMNYFHEQDVLIFIMSCTSLIMICLALYRALEMPLLAAMPLRFNISAAPTTSIQGE
jgi:exopolysaccharide production protein ExoZ